MSDFTVPSYRVRPPKRGLGAGFQVPWRMVAVSGAILCAAAVGAGVVWGVSRAVNRGVPTIEADARPIRVKPEDPGGMRVANQDERIFESARRNPGGVATGTARLTPEAERPDLAALRQAASRAQQAQAQAQAQAQPPAASTPATLPAVQPDAAPVRPPLVNPSLSPAQNGRGAASSSAQQAPPAPAPNQAVQNQAAPNQAAQAPAAQTPPISPPPMPANAPARGGRFVVQLGAVSSEEAAQGEWARLQGRIPELAGRQPVITRVDRGDLPPMWRIRTGGLPDAKVAAALCTAAKAKGAPCAVIGG
ncbi:Sporulation related domain-containing protein [Roseomonas rosea]|uniref:Sporulation related domain-containing protein n=1 Tax=Muricoccus roseus TaxID=198092 RepID=A0A1M6F4F1_9PROT|nr:SPOR domain-containing protein [Roseomonas rosea]SHI92536.1 Sporulation related domain-containing protein [Roseomonas rosea]